MVGGRVPKLEGKISKLFSAVGFKVSRNIDIAGYNIEVLAERGNFKVVCDCEHEDTNNQVRDFIFKWKEIKKKIKADKVILIIAGFEVLGEDREMARRDGIIIWERQNLDQCINRFFHDSDDEKKRILGLLGIEAYIDPNLSYVPEKGEG